MTKKRLLVYAHYYYPDVASTGQILTELCEGLKDNFDITVICTVPSYTGKIDENYKVNKYYIEEINEIRIIRVRVPEFSKDNKKSRVKNLLAYFFRAIYATFKCGKQDYVFAISQPPIFGGVLGSIGKFIKKAKFIYNIQDFNPEQILAVGYTKSKCILKVAMFMDKHSCKKSNKVIVVGRDMQETLKRRFNYNNVPENCFINNWIDETKVYPLKSDNDGVKEFKQKYDLMNKKIVMYSGNIGLYYDLENLIKVIGKFKERNDVIFAFIGEGSVKNQLVEYVEQNDIKNIKFIPYQPKEKLIYSLNAADIHFVVNAKGIKGVSVPSKLYGVMAAGKTVFGVLEKNSEARMIVEESNCGICNEPRDYDAIYLDLKKMLDNIDSYREVGLKGSVYVNEYIKKDIAIEKYIQEIIKA